MQSYTNYIFSWLPLKKIYEAAISIYQQYISGIERVKLVQSNSIYFNQSSHF